MSIVNILTIVILALITIIASLIYIKYKEDKIISFQEAYNLTEYPILTFYYGNQKLNFLIDTGSNVSHINKEVLNSTNIKMIEKGTCMGINGAQSPVSACHLELFINKLKVENIFCCTDLSAAFNFIKNKSGVTLHGIIGGDFLSKYKYVIDYNKKVIKI